MKVLLQVKQESPLFISKGCIFCMWSFHRYEVLLFWDIMIVDFNEISIKCGESLVVMGVSEKLF